MCDFSCIMMRSLFLTFPPPVSVSDAKLNICSSPTQNFLPPRGSPVRFPPFCDFSSFSHSDRERTDRGRLRRSLDDLAERRKVSEKLKKVLNKKGELDFFVDCRENFHVLAFFFPPTVDFSLLFPLEFAASAESVGFLLSAAAAAGGWKIQELLASIEGTQRSRGTKLEGTRRPLLAGEKSCRHFFFAVSVSFSRL